MKQYRVKAYMKGADETIIVEAYGATVDEALDEAQERAGEDYVLWGCDIDEVTA